MCADGLANVAAKAKFGHELCRLKPSNVLGVVEEVLDDSESLAHANGQARQNDFFQNDAVRVNAGQASSGNEHDGAIVEFLEHEQRAREKRDGSISGCYAEAVVL